MVSVTQNSHHHKPLMVQAPVRALDPHGLTVVTAGTVAFALGTAACWWLSPQLAASGRLWYLGVAITGTVIGLLGLGFGLFLKARRHDGAAGSGEPRRSLDPLSVEQAHVDADGVPDRE